MINNGKTVSIRAIQDKPLASPRPNRKQSERQEVSSINESEV